MKGVAMPEIRFTPRRDCLLFDFFRLSAGGTAKKRNGVKVANRPVEF